MAGFCRVGKEKIRTKRIYLQNEGSDAAENEPRQVCCMIRARSRPDLESFLANHFRRSGSSPLAQAASGGERYVAHFGRTSPAIDDFKYFFKLAGYRRAKDALARVSNCPGGRSSLGPGVEGNTGFHLSAERVFKVYRFIPFL